MIPLEILEMYAHTLKAFPKHHIIFTEGEQASFYFQLKNGQVKMYNLSEDGKEFVQGYFEAGSSFGEPPLFGDFTYPASAMTLTDCSVYLLSKTVLFQILKDHPEVHLNFTKSISKRMGYKAKIMKEVSIHPPEHRILTLLHHLKKASKTDQPFEVPLTRQQISELTGLRVETVIRAIKKLEESKKLSIKKRKVFL